MKNYLALCVLAALTISGFSFIHLNSGGSYNISGKVDVFFRFVDAELVQVTMEQGILKGEKLTTIIGNQTYYSFKGVPFAAPPVGTLRFKAPQPPLNWTGVRDATAHGASCPQIDIFTLIKDPGNEDCLFLNVYTPNLTPNKTLSVIVWIYGGGFKSGSGNSSTFGPDFLIRKDVVLVTFNYRLETLGFLSLGTKEVPGNAGLKDQVAALRWVKKNIGKFGGNPNKVTILGQSAGAVSVGFHVVSPMSKGLFKRAIGLSGVPFCEFVTSYRPVERAFALGKQLGINTTNSTLLLNYLQTVPVSQLYDTNPTVLVSEEKLANVIKFYPFVPVIEKDFGVKNTFISQDTLEIMRNGTPNAVDVMFGYASQETATVIDLFNTTYLINYDKSLELLTPLKIFFKNTPDVNYEVALKILKYYFPDAVLYNMKQFIAFTSDVSFVYDVIRFVSNLNIKDHNRYLYKFSMSSGLNSLGNLARKYGFDNYTGHLDDLNYIFSNSNQDMSLLAEGSTERQLIDVMCTLITNFAKHGNPTPSGGSIDTLWPVFNSTTKSYMEIGNTLSVGSDPEADTMTFWNGIYESVGLI